MKILVTGAGGFVGVNLVPFLTELGHVVHSLSLRDDQWEFTNFNEFDAIIHLAGKAHDTSNVSRPEEYYLINRDLTKRLFDKFLASSCLEFYYFSSVKAVADSVEGILDEQTESNPLTPYGKSKLQAENYLNLYLNNKGKKIFVIRPCMIHGPGNKGNLNLLYNVVKKGLPWPLGAFHNQRSFLSIKNLNFLISKMLGNECLSSGTYFFADDDFLSTNEIVQLISEILSKKGKIFYLSPSFMRFVARVGDLIQLPLNSERLKKLTESYQVSNIKIKEDLGIEKLPISAIEGLKQTLMWFKQNDK